MTPFRFAPGFRIADFQSSTSHTTICPFARTRHAGHLDAIKSGVEELAKFEQFASYGALGIGRLVEVNTEQVVDLDALLRQLATPKKGRD